MKYGFIPFAMFFSGRLLKESINNLNTPGGILRFLFGIAIFVVSIWLIIRKDDNEDSSEIWWVFYFLLILHAAISSVNFKKQISNIIQIFENSLSTRGPRYTAPPATSLEK